MGGSHNRYSLKAPSRPDSMTISRPFVAKQGNFRLSGPSLLHASQLLKAAVDVLCAFHPVPQSVTPWSVTGVPLPLLKPTTQFADYFFKIVFMVTDQKKQQIAKYGVHSPVTNFTRYKKVLKARSKVINVLQITTLGVPNQYEFRKGADLI